MGKLDYGKLASGLKLSTEKEEPETPKEDKAEGGDESDDKPGALGDRAIAAMKAGNGEAFEECIKRIRG